MMNMFRSLLCAVIAGLHLSACVHAASKPETFQAAKPVATKPDADGWKQLFDGKTLKGWKEADFAGKGPVIVTNGTIVMKSGYMTGIAWTNESELLRMNYEIALEAKRTEGNDFFSAVTFPVGTNPCTFVVGGWGGSLVGLSCLDGEDAANNETSKSFEFKQDQWYNLRIQVKPDKILAWVDDEKLVDVVTTDRRIGIRIECEACLPLGLATWSTTGVVRNIRVRPLPE